MFCCYNLFADIGHVIDSFCLRIGCSTYISVTCDLKNKFIKVHRLLIPDWDRAFGTTDSISFGGFAGNSAVFSQNFHTMEVGEITVFSEFHWFIYFQDNVQK